MEKIDSLNQVAEFHKTFKHPVLETPQLPDENRCKLRVSLLQEELNELQESIDSKDVVGVADALSDIQYVLSGAILEFGMGDVFKALFDEVHRSNMSKTCATEEEAQKTVDFYTQTKDTPCHYVKEGDKYLVYRDADKKTLKSVNYSPADLEQFLKK